MKQYLFQNNITTYQLINQLIHNNPFTSIDISDDSKSQKIQHKSIQSQRKQTQTIRNSVQILISKQKRLNNQINKQTITTIQTMSLCEFVLNSPLWKEIDAVVKYKKYPEFKKQLDKIEKQYLHDLNMSLYSNLQQLQKCSALQVVSSKIPKPKVAFYLNLYAFKVQFQQDDQHKFYLLLIRILDQKLRQNKQTKYSIIYYHCLSQSTFPFSFLNQTFKKLPLFYYAMLDKIYVVQPNFLVKNTGMFDFGRLHKLFTKRIVYVDNLYELGKLDEIQKSNILETLPDVLKQLKAHKEQKKALKTAALQNIQNKTPKKSQENLAQGPIIIKAVKKQDFFTIPLQKHKLTPQGLPIPLVTLLETLKSHSQFLNHEGIFRKSGSIQEEEQIINELQKMPSVGLLKNIDDHSGYAVAGVVKKFFTKLKVPIISYEIYNEIMTTQKIEEGKEAEFVKSIMSKLPVLNKRVLIYLILFLKQQVISRKEQNKMNNYNMSVCFCPCIFRAEQATLQDLMNSGKYAKILDIIINKFQQIFTQDEAKLCIGKQKRGSKGSRGSRSSKENMKSNIQDSPTKILI